MQRAGGLNALILSPTGGAYRAFNGSDLAKGASLAVTPWFTRPQERLFPLSSESSWGPLLVSHWRSAGRYGLSKPLISGCTVM